MGLSEACSLTLEGPSLTDEGLKGFGIVEALTTLEGFRVSLVASARRNQLSDYLTAELSTASVDKPVENSHALLTFEGQNLDR
jgi:hypothetical protein